ncbi:MAG: hypothetical protein ACPG31_00585 [Planctomycetota bacterium]
MIRSRIALLLACLPLFASTTDLSPWKYKEVELEGWKIHVQKKLYAKKDLREEVLALLRIELWEIRTRLPQPVVERLQEVEMRFHLDRPECPGGVYHPSAQWLTDHDLPANWAEGIEFGVAANFLSWSRNQPDMVLHELSHAWHHQVLGYDHAGIQAAFQKLTESAALENILYITGGRQKAYALTNPMEFFAEMSEAWWGVNDMYPFVRGELMEAFPEVADLMPGAWTMP